MDGEESFMYRRCVCVSILLMMFLLCISVVVLHCIGYDLRIVQSNETIGIPSRDGSYYLVEMSDSTGKYLLYSVIQLDSSDPQDYEYYPKTVFVTDDFWYHSRFTKDYGWISETNDFYIDSTDSGLHQYSYDGTTWASTY